ncbi:MAG: TetR/AcrR family transcriptional regulator, partial [bacterium]|nr:TetR/AcrR family transcriptional regulator [bacterium]
MPESTRNRILSEGARLIRMNGFVATGLSSILTAAEVPKGSFYYYFNSKEEFGLELIKSLGTQIERAFKGYLCCDYDEPSLVRLKQFFNFFKK